MRTFLKDFFLKPNNVSLASEDFCLLDEFDIIKISELFITTNPILDGQWSDQLFNEFKLIKEYSLNSGREER